MRALHFTEVHRVSGGEAIGVLEGAVAGGAVCGALFGAICLGSLPCHDQLRMARAVVGGLVGGLCGICMTVTLLAFTLNTHDE